MKDFGAMVKRALIDPAPFFMFFFGGMLVLGELIALIVLRVFIGLCDDQTNANAVDELDSEWVLVDQIDRKR